MASTENNHDKAIANLKHELEVCINALKESDVWLRFEKLYRDLSSTQELAATKKTTLEELLGLGDPKTRSERSIHEKRSQLILGDQQEPEIVAEVEKGS
jgi:hypothetical protein